MRIKGNSKPRGNSWCGGEERRGAHRNRNPNRGTRTLIRGPFCPKGALLQDFIQRRGESPEEGVELRRAK